MTRLFQLMGVVIVFSTIALAINAMAGAAIFVDALAFVFLAGIVGGGLLVSYRPSITWKAIRGGLGIASSSSQEELDLHIDVLNQARRLAWVGGGLASTIGLVRIMWGAAFGNVTHTQALAGGAIAVVPLFYAAILAELVFALLRHGVIARFRSDTARKCG